MAVAISAFMLGGVLTIAPLFLTIKRSAEFLQRAKEELEIKVAERTEELRDANAHLSVELDERRRAEQRMAQYAADLARSNAELEQFAYVASHDLQEPLRMVASFTQLLARRYRGQLDKDADEFIGFAVDGATRMQTLINDLLAYSRVGTRGKPFAPTDCGAVLQMALDNLARSVEESGAVITHDPLPTVPGDEVQLTQLFQNLIANAIKFRGPETPRIHVSAAEPGPPMGLRGPGQRHRHCPGAAGTHFCDLSAAAPPRGISRHRHRPGHLQKNRGAPRRPHSGWNPNPVRAPPFISA